MRDVHCDFCNTVLGGHAWECPCEDFRYREPRTNADGTGPTIEGSLGSWLACDICAALVRNGRRENLVARALMAAYGTLNPNLRFERIRDVTILQDQFWSHRLGAPVLIGSEVLEQIAQEPAYEERPEEDQ